MEMERWKGGSDEKRPNMPRLNVNFIKMHSIGSQLGVQAIE